MIHKRTKRCSKRTKKRGKRTKKKQFGGVKLSDIITGGNKNEFIGQEVEINRLLPLLPPEYETELTGYYRINELQGRPGFILEQEHWGEEVVHDNLLVVYYPHIEDYVILYIPSNLYHLTQNLSYQQNNLTYIVNLIRRNSTGSDRGGPLNVHTTVVPHITAY